MTRVLGLDLGTSSIGWAIIEAVGRESTLIDKGVHIFEKGVGMDKNAETSLASERTSYRAARRLKQRRKWRKQATLRVLQKHKMCPGLTDEDVDRWRNDKKYPESDEFRAWLNTIETTADGKPAGPYYYRWLAVTSKMNLADEQDRYRLGRAFYHLAQRRGYKSNRVGGDEKEGAVMAHIKVLDEAKGNRTLGQYYYEDCLGKEPVRGGGHYTSRKDYEEEFAAICQYQEIPANISDELRRAIFYQRPLKSQKGSVGKCLLEPGKSRAPISHPLFERFRALQTLSNVRITEPRQTESRCLTPDEHTKVLDWLMSRSKPEPFEKLARKLVPRGAAIQYGKECDDDSVWRFNYRSDMAVSPCPTCARLAGLFGADWQEELARRYTKGEGKTVDQVVDDVWHALFSFDDKEKLQAYGKQRLGLNDQEAEKFAAPLRVGYANISLAAIRKIVPYLERGIIYSHAVFMANLQVVLRNTVKDWESEEPMLLEQIGALLRDHQVDTAIEKSAQAICRHYESKGEDLLAMQATVQTMNALAEQTLQSLCSCIGKEGWERIAPDDRDGICRRTLDSVFKHARRGQPVTVETIEQRIQGLLTQRYNVTEKDLARLYHPSAIETYRKCLPAEDGHLRLGSPRVASIKNPVFMRTMHRLRHVINTLLAEGLIDSNTRIRVEMARDLNTANQRAAIYRYQRESERARDGYRKAMEEAGYQPTETDILKYQLWEEQSHKCLYTSKSIGLSDFLGDNPIFDIEHTIPRSLRLDNSQANLTLCDAHFNRKEKRNKLPSQLPGADEIYARAEALWRPQIEELEVLVEKRRNASRQAADKPAKDKARQEFHYYQNKVRYLREKLRNFKMAEAPDGFTNAQLVDTRIICKYAVQYLKSLFPKVYSVKARVVSGVKEIWGLVDKTRENHVHHCIDAVVTACLSPAFTEALAAYYHEYERYEKHDAPKPTAPEPWLGFSTYLNTCIEREVLVVHHTRDNLLKQTQKKLRVRGRIQRHPDGTPILLRGSSVRGQLHKESIYGVVQSPPVAGADHHGEKYCVIRKPLDKNFASIKDIVDPAVRAIVQKQQDRLKAGETIWFNEAAGIPIKKVRIRVRVQPESAIPIRGHRDVSKHDYKRHQHVENAGNYITALYRGLIDGRPKASWRIIRNMDAVQAARDGTWDTILPQKDEKGLTLCNVLKSGSMVLFYKDSPSELHELPIAELSRRLYRVTVMEGRLMKFNHHSCALSAVELGSGDSSINWESVTPESRLRLSVNGINILVEGADFKMNPLGHIQWIESSDA